MRRTRCLAMVLGLVALTGLGSLPGCGRGKKERVGPLKDWMVGLWVRSDDGTGWEFQADGQMITTGRVPVTGDYSVEEPDKVVVRVLGANAITSANQLGLPVEAGPSLHIHFVVTDDEMRPVDVKSEVVLRKR